EKLDRAVTVGPMHGHDGDNKNDRHRDACKGNEGAQQHSEAAQNFDSDGQPRKQLCIGHTERTQDLGEGIRAACKFGVSVLYKAEADDEPERYRVPACPPLGNKAAASMKKLL